MKNTLRKSLLGMMIFAAVLFTLNYFATERQEFIIIISLIQCTLIVGIFIIIYNFYKEWKESTSNDN